MNKATKGAIAAGAAAVLLLGGLGSYALWQDERTIAGGEINSGELQFVSNAPGAWTETTSGTAIGSDPSGFLIVPGDILTYSSSYTIESAGPNIRATLTADFDEVFADDTSDLAAALDPEITVTGAGGTVTSGQIVPLTLTAGSQVVNVTVKLTFDADTTDLIAQNESVDLNAMTLTLDQVRP
ncbi:MULTISPECIES: alternate-type signal peptide domain-containing protein [Nocardiaceae]|uniref:alternate-type signal peptide domain-containing protein n=1 Tax=Nocardiaceae TaxID=85025 RepID=UPI00050CB8B8|nr:MULTISPECIES: alternate-type signal peptide domain-containing protein [Rhodococcus]OZC47093.1 alternate-type signal peptide domain-containing protein [Rhodococcus sp. WWJCD1]OZE80449.1 alternate-type signal peptide domain-containing protein [Rhodococcus sp. 15-649-2-2]